jgi:ComF family protein
VVGLPGTEAVFSSSGTGFRIRATQGQAAHHETAQKQLAQHGFVSFAKRAAATLFFTFFPSDCRRCNAPLIRFPCLPVCQSCLDGIRPLQGSYCAVCGEALPLQSFIDSGETERWETRCMLCQRADPPFERAVAYGTYDAGVRDLTHVLKFQAVRPAAAELGGMLAEPIANLEQVMVMPVGTIVAVPVPLHARRRAQRGFNQAETIARAALQALGRPNRFELCPEILLRRRETGSQIGLTRHQRRENLRGAFAISDPSRILKRDILLVDDVFTTRTTAAECARVLLRAGAARVWVATVARTLKWNASNTAGLLKDDDLPDGEFRDRESPAGKFEEGSEDRLAVAAAG